MRAFFTVLARMRWMVLAGAASLAFVLIGLVFLSAALEEVKDTARERLEEADTPEELEELARNYRRYVGPHAYLRMGNILFDKAQEATEAEEKRAFISRAREAFSRGARLFPKHFLAPYLLEGEGLCLEEMGRHDEAVAAFKRAYEAAPEGHLAPKLEADIGRNYALFGEEERALEYLESAVWSQVRVERGMEADWLLNARLLRAKVMSKEVQAPPGTEAAQPEGEGGARSPPRETPAAPVGEETEAGPEEAPQPPGAQE